MSDGTVFLICLVLTLIFLFTFAIPMYRLHRESDALIRRADAILDLLSKTKKEGSDAEEKQD